MSVFAIIARERFSLRAQDTLTSDSRIRISTFPFLFICQVFVFVVVVY